MPRIFIPIPSVKEDRISITGDKARYLSTVLRCKKGNELIVFDGEGNCLRVAGVTRALSSSRNYPTSYLLELLSRPGISRPAVLEIINAHKARFSVRDLLNAAYQQEPNEKAALFKVIGEVADATAVDELVARLEGKDPIARMHIIAVLARFNLPKVRDALQARLKDPNKLVRAGALQAISHMDGPIDPALIARMLRDTELDVQNLAVEVLCKARHPDTVQHLVWRC